MSKQRKTVGGHFLMTFISVGCFLVTVCASSLAFAKPLGNCCHDSMTVLLEEAGMPAEHARMLEMLGKKGESCSMEDIRSVAEANGIHLVGKEINYSELRAGTAPSIAHFHWGHFVAVLEAGPEWVYISETPGKVIPVAREIFLRQWSGHVLVPDDGNQSYVGVTGAGVAAGGLVLSAIGIGRYRRHRGNNDRWSKSHG